MRIKWWLGQLRYKKTRLVAAYERARYGWSKWDIHASWDSNVGAAIGRQLIYFADNTLAHPGYISAEEWSQQLRQHGTALAALDQDVPMPEILHQYYSNVSLSNNKMIWPKETPEINEARENYYQAEQEIYDNAKLAFVWLSHNFGNLWD